MIPPNETLRSTMHYWQVMVVMLLISQKRCVRHALSCVQQKVVQDAWVSMIAWVVAVDGVQESVHARNPLLQRF
jgi:hypothetical protein